MSESNNTKKDRKKEFIHENIVNRGGKKGKGNVLRHFALIACSAVVFGLIAAATFVFSEPIVRNHFKQKDSRQYQSISIPKDDPENNGTSENDVASDSSALDTLPESGSVKETEASKEGKPVGELVESAFASHEYTSDDVKRIYSRLDEVCRKLDNSLVAVDSVKNTRDWFNNPVEKEGHYSGIVFTKTQTEIGILCPAEALGEADLIKVSFNDAGENNARLRAVDKISGLAVIYVPVEDIDSKVLETIEPATLGNSYLTARGNVVMAIGSPLGISRSTSYGYISHIAKDISVTDGNSRLFYSDLKTDAQAGSFLINLDAEVIAWVTDKYKDLNSDNISTAYAISDYKELIEKMVNGNPVQYIGIEAVNVSKKMKDTGMPEGIYVGAVTPGSPVYDSGIQPGDIIKALNEQEISNINTYQKILGQLQIGSDAVITVMRNNGKDEYKELKFNIKVGERLLRKEN